MTTVASGPLSPFEGPAALLVPSFQVRHSHTNSSVSSLGRPRYPHRHATPQPEDSGHRAVLSVSRTEPSRHFISC